MKKLFALILALSLLCALAACAEAQPASLGVRPDPTAPSLDTRPPDEAPTEAVTEPVTEPAASVPAVSGESIHVPEAVFYDQDGIRAAVLECDLPARYDEETDCVIPVRIENNTTASIDFTLNDDIVVLNNYMVPAWLFETVPAGEAVTGELEIMGADLAMLNVQAPKTFTADYLAFDDDSYDTVSSGFGTFESANGVSAPAQLSSDNILFSGSGITIAEVGLYIYTDGSAIYYIQIQNDNDQKIAGDAGGYTVNDTSIDTYDYSIIYENCVTILPIHLYESDLRGAGLDADSIENLEFTINFLDYNTYQDLEEVSISARFQ